MDTTQVGIQAAKLMDRIAADPELPEDAEIMEVGLVVQIRLPGDPDDEVIHLRSSSLSRPFQVGLFTLAAAIAGEIEDPAD